MVKTWVVKLNVGVMKVLNFRIQFSQITAKIIIMVNNMQVAKFNMGG